MTRYTMTDEQFERFKEAMTPVPAIALPCGAPTSIQERGMTAAGRRDVLQMEHCTPMPRCRPQDIPCGALGMNCPTCGKTVEDFFSHIDAQYQHWPDRWEDDELVIMYAGYASA